MREAFTFDDVLLVPAYNHYESRQDVDISVTDRSGRFSLKLPVMTANMDSITESAMANFIGGKGGIGVLHRMMSIDRNVSEFRKCTLPTFVSVGCSEAELERAAALRDAGATLFVVDVAHGHARYVGKTLKQLRQLLPDACLMAGNVATYAGADYLASVGADIIKVGIGPGSVCTTRVKTGHGVPQLTAIKDCARCDRSIVADGGIRYAGDVVKALAFGADFVMLGGMLAGTRPTPGEKIQDSRGDWVKTYRGMASREVADDHLGGIAEWKTAEGISVAVPYRDDEDLIIADIVGGLRSGLTYAGSRTIRELQRKLNYVVITPSGWREGMPHKSLL
jgi:IMP dehydrogenase